MKNINWMKHIEYLVLGLLGTVAIAGVILITALISDAFGGLVEMALGVVSAYALGYFIKNWLK